MDHNAIGRICHTLRRARLDYLLLQASAMRLASVMTSTMREVQAGFHAVDDADIASTAGLGRCIDLLCWAAMPQLKLTLTVGTCLQAWNMGLLRTGCQPFASPANVSSRIPEWVGCQSSWRLRHVESPAPSHQGGREH